MKAFQNLFLIALVLTLAFGKLHFPFNSKRNFIFYEIEGKRLKLLIANEPKEWEKGLMFVKKPVDFEGMIFIFPDKKIRYFWNKNTFVDLNIYWLDDEKIVGKDFLPSIEKTKKPQTVRSPLPVNKVLEIIQ